MQGGPKRRILYGVHGYGRGHAARAQAILPELTNRYEVLVLAGDDAYDQLHEEYPVVRIPVLRFYHGKRRRRSLRLTFKRNVPAMLDMLMEGPIFQMVRRVMEGFAPDVVLSDSEGWTHRAARSLGIPRVSFDHYGILVHCHLDMPLLDRLIAWQESFAYKALVCKPDRNIAAAFYDGKPRSDSVRVVGAILRQEVRRVEPTDGDHLLVYFSNASVHFTPRVEQALTALDCPVKIYGLDRTDAQANLEFCPPGNLPFIEDLANCRAVFSTAGNQLISEAIHFGKPLLVLPEESLEQRLNAQYVQRWRIGMEARPKDVSADLLRRFLNHREEFAGNVRQRRRDGLAEAMEAIRQAVDELAPDPS